MSIMQKLHTLLRAGARESAERITDANAIRIYRQEVVDAENLLQRRRYNLAAMIASRKDLEREISLAQRRILGREQQIANISPEQRGEALLLLAAKDIAASQIHLDDMQHRLSLLAERINGEELQLRKLVSEIKEHRRELGILATEVKAGSRGPGNEYQHTVAGHLATLRQTRASISAAVSRCDRADASMTEAIDRVDGDPVERELAAQGRDQGSLQLAQVLERLRGLQSPPQAV